MESFRSCIVKVRRRRVILLSPVVGAEERNMFIQINVSHYKLFTSLLPTQQDNKNTIIATFTHFLDSRSIIYQFLIDELHRMDVAEQIINGNIDFITDKVWHKLEVINRVGMAPQETFVVNLSIEIVTEIDDADAVVDETSLGITSRPAARHAVDSLERVDIRGDEKVVCTICLSEMGSDTVDVRAMPCSHRYHRDCIVSWLQNRSSCPLCRYQLPTAH
ncbi:hypothetical protein AMTRI_Chr10g225180 [Amborella trichopoda]